MANEPAARIEHLCDAPGAAPGAAPTLAAWFIAEWEPWYGSGGDAAAAADLAACASRDALPICLVALDDGDVPLGTVALKQESAGSETGQGPWLAALLVDPARRREGIATALIATLEDEARRLGFAAIYTSTDTAASLMQRRGWTEVGTTDTLRGRVAIFRRDL